MLLLKCFSYCSCTKILYEPFRRRFLFKSALSWQPIDGVGSGWMRIVAGGAQNGGSLGASSFWRLRLAPYDVRFNWRLARRETDRHTIAPALPLARTSRLHRKTQDRNTKYSADVMHARLYSSHILMPVNTFSQIVLYGVGIVCRPHQTIFWSLACFRRFLQRTDFGRFKVGSN